MEGFVKVLEQSAARPQRSFDGGSGTQWIGWRIFSLRVRILPCQVEVIHLGLLCIYRQGSGDCEVECALCLCHAHKSLHEKASEATRDAKLGSMLRFVGPGSPSCRSGGLVASVIVQSFELGKHVRKMLETAVWAGTAGSGSVEYNLLISCTICWVTGIGGVFLAAARARPRALVQAVAATLQERDCLCSAPDLVVPREIGVTSHSARPIDHRDGQSSDQKRSSRASRK